MSERKIEDPRLKLLIKRWPTYQRMKEAEELLDDEFLDLGSNIKERVEKSVGSGWKVQFSPSSHGIRLHPIIWDGWCEHKKQVVEFASLQYWFLDSWLVNLFGQSGVDGGDDEYPHIILYCHGARSVCSDENRGKAKKLIEAVARRTKGPFEEMAEWSQADGQIAYINLPRIDLDDLLDLEFVEQFIADQLVEAAKELQKFVTMSIKQKWNSS